MREKELRIHSNCSLCNKGIGASGFPMFWVVKIERIGIKIDSVKRQDGLTALLGGHAKLASIMGPDEEMTTPLMEQKTFTVCEDCSCNDNRCVASIAELEGK